jgi:hypothetical protein
VKCLCLQKSISCFACLISINASPTNTSDTPVSCMCHKVRPDNPENVIRSETSRQICPHSIQPQFTTQRRIGSVTVRLSHNLHFTLITSVIQIINGY